MGVHWYARSKELTEVERQQEEVERRIVAANADAPAIDAALDERETLFTREDAARAELARRGASVTVASTRAWPPHVREHVEALGAEPERPLLDVLGWGIDYYIENLRDAGLPMRGFSQSLDYLHASPERARALGEELLRHASSAHRVLEIRRSREAGLWLVLWGSVDCCVVAGD
jgi:hypothetical protein